MDYSNNTNGHDINQPPQQFLFKKASVGERLLAFIIDHIIFSFAFVFLFTILMVSIQLNEAMVVFFIIIFFIVVFSAYGFRDIFKGQSIGKRVTGIGVRYVSDNFVVPSASKLFLRQIFSFLWPIEFLVLAFSSENRKIGDIIAGTSVYNLREYENFIQNVKRMEYINQMQGVVSQGAVQQGVRTQGAVPYSAGPYSAVTQDAAFAQAPVAQPNKPKKKRIAIIITAAVLVFVMLIGAFVFGITSILRNHPSHLAAQEYIRANPEITAAIGEVEGFGFMPGGSIHMSGGRGDADFAINVRGTHGNARVFIELQMRSGGDWEVVRFTFMVR